MQEPTERLLNDIRIEHDVESCQHPLLLCVYFLYVVSAVSIHSYIKAHPLGHSVLYYIIEYTTGRVSLLSVIPIINTSTINATS